MFKSTSIIGAIIGDIVGSAYEWNNKKTVNFDLFTPESDFTDDTVLTIAVADCLVNQKDFSTTIKAYGKKYKSRGYGGMFRRWLKSENIKPYGSYGNGSAMRVSPVGFAFQSLEKVLEIAKQSADVTHNHPEGIKGAQVVASSVFLAKNGASKSEIKDYVCSKFNYNLNFTLDEIRSSYTFDATCQGSVPQAVVAFLESYDYESSIRLAVSIGGDSDTIACITGGIASAFYKKIPQFMFNTAINKLRAEFIDILQKFDENFLQ